MTTYRETLRYTKTVEIALEVDNCRVTSLRISGDFFVYPEDTVEIVERKAMECSSVECLSEALSLLKEATVLGFDPDDLSRRIINAYRSICRDT